MNENTKKWGWEIMMENATLKNEIRKLTAELEEAKQQAETNWACLESVACGESLNCPTCNGRMPCCCDKS